MTLSCDPSCSWRWIRWVRGVQTWVCPYALTGCELHALPDRLLVVLLDCLQAKHFEDIIRSWSGQRMNAIGWQNLKSSVLEL